MNSATFSLELITPCFCAGARPSLEAELRAPSIRGQLRWWFRTLGGFKSLAPKPVAAQENDIFGMVDGPSALASPLTIRVTSQDSNLLRSRQTRNAEGMNAPAGSERGYLLFPLHQTRRAVFDVPQLPKFEVALQWRGDPKLWADVQALMTVFGHLGSLGFRSRRAMGALAFRGQPPSLKEALPSFVAPQQLILKSMPARDAGQAINLLAQWLRKWRSYGRTSGNQLNRFRPGFEFARKDHDAGLSIHQGPVFRAALGLPLEQTFSYARRTTRWDESWNARERRGEGRFASPVLLRPYRTAQNQWLALIIFADAHAWPASKKVFLNGQPRAVSRDLYEAMKNDRDLRSFPPI